jgi:bifunctional non-homologous end joining protein LigD
VRRNCDGSRRDLDRAEGMRRRSWSPMTLMELDAKDVRPEAPEERRKHLARLLSRIDKAMRQGIQLSEAITGDGAAIFCHACGLGLEGIVSKRIGSRYVSGRTRAWLKTKNPSFQRS